MAVSGFEKFEAIESILSKETMPIIFSWLEFEESQVSRFEDSYRVTILWTSKLRLIEFEEFIGIILF